MEITLPTLIDLFITTKQTEGRSPRTLEWYRDKLGQFARFKGNGSDVPLKDLHLDDARAFIASLQSRDTRWNNHPYQLPVEGGLSPYTIHAYVRALKAFSTWLHEEDFTKHNLFARLKRPKLPQPMIEILSDQEIADIIGAINPNRFLGARLYVMVLLLLDTGIRASELVGLTVDNTFINEDYLKAVVSVKF